MGYRWNESFDAFVHGVRAVWAAQAKTSPTAAAKEWVEEEVEVTKPSRGKARGKGVRGRSRGGGRGRGRGGVKGKERAVDVDDGERTTTADFKKVEDERRFVLFIEHAERLKDSMPDLLVPLTRFAEVVSVLLWHCFCMGRLMH